jgi:stalled ribosome rescue protein Dom34
MAHYHVAVWLDHREAKIFSFGMTGASEWEVKPHDQHVHLHHKAGLGDSGRAPLDKKYLHAIAEAVKDAGEILIVGPGTAKSELKHHLEAHDPQVAKKVVAVEPMDHPSDGELLRYAKQAFKRIDAMRG